MRHEQHAGQELRSMATIARSVRCRIEMHGLKVKPTSRLGLGSSRILAECSSRRPIVPAAEFALLSAACRDFVLFDFILDAPRILASQPEFSKRLRLALKDGARAAKHGRNTPGRDTQVELFAATALVRSGLPVKFGTPDIRTRLDGKHFFLEAKRPRALGSIVDAVRTAADQIHATGCPGAIYLDVSLAMNPSETHLDQIVPRAAFDYGITDDLRSALAPVNRELDRILRGTKVTDILFHYDIVRTVGEGEWNTETQINRFTNKGLDPRHSSLSPKLLRALHDGFSGKDERFAFTDSSKV